MDATTPVVFLHAFPLNAGMWAGQVEALPDRATLAPDFPGFGGRAPGVSDLEGFARSALADMDAAGIGKAVVVGLSMGGYVAFRLLGLAPERVVGLVLADTKAGADNEAGRTKRTDQAARVRAEGVAWMPDAFAPALLGPTTMASRPEVVGYVKELVGKADPEGVARALEAMRERPDSTPQLGTIRVPTLVVVGEEDGLTPVADARILADGIPGAELEVLPGAGHLANLEDPAAFNAALTSFLGR